MAGPLAGIRVIDLSSMLSGPWAADILGDQGADVIKVEVPAPGDHVRSLPQPPRRHVGDVRQHQPLEALADAEPQGARGASQVLKRLVATADVVVQNFRPGVVERLGIGYEDLPARQPADSIYLSISGLGERGPSSGSGSTTP